MIKILLLFIIPFILLITLFTLGSPIWVVILLSSATNIIFLLGYLWHRIREIIYIHKLRKLTQLSEKYVNNNLPKIAKIFAPGGYPERDRPFVDLSRVIKDCKGNEISNEECKDCNF